MFSRSTFECFGLVIHGFSWPEVEVRLDDALRHQQPLWMVTANPEIMLHAKQKPGYWQDLRQADLRLVDGMGLQLVGWLSQASPKRLPGVDLAEHVLKLASDRKLKVAFTGGEQGVADRAAWTIRQRLPDLRIIAEEGGKITHDGTGDEANEETLHRLTMEAPDILFVAYGHPKQEAWIARHLTELPSVKVAIGLGGTFDYWAGKAHRAPSIVRSFGLEWLWRLLKEPRRWRRIVDAVIIFPILALKEKKLNTAKIEGE